MMKNNGQTPNSQDTGTTTKPEEISAGRHRISSYVLFGARNEIVIVHNDEDYRLRITRAGKLILTK